MPRPKRNMTPVERIIVVAIIGILMSIILPNLQRTTRRARTMRPRASAPVAHRYSTPEPAGQLNTIDVSRAAERNRRSGPEHVARLISAVVRVVIVFAVVVIAIIAIKQGIRRAQQ